MIAFKYRACNVVDGRCRDIDMLLSDQIYASPIGELNDCFEGRYADKVDVQLDAIAEAFHYDMGALKKQWSELKKTVEEAGIYSMSLSENGVPNNKVLWPLYAGGYAGFCIAYDVDKLVQNEQFPTLVNRLTVKYQKEVPEVEVTDISRNGKLLEKMIGTKSEDWRAENEYRLVFDKAGVKTYNKAALKSVYFGYKMPEEHKQRIVEGLQGRDVDIYEMAPLTGSYGFAADLKFSLRRPIMNALTEEDFEIIDINHRPKVENFYVFYKRMDRCDDAIKHFLMVFREMFATMASNVELYDSKEVKPLLKKYPLNDAECEFMRKHFISRSSFDAPDFIMREVF